MKNVLHSFYYELVYRLDTFVTLVPGILTGSVYKDYGLLWNGLYGESVTNESVSVVKTHEWGPSTRNSFDKAILLLRFPGPAIQAEFNRRSGGHLGYASIDRFTRNEGRGISLSIDHKLQICIPQ